MPYPPFFNRRSIFRREVQPLAGAAQRSARNVAVNCDSSTTPNTVVARAIGKVINNKRIAAYGRHKYWRVWIDANYGDPISAALSGLTFIDFFGATIGGGTYFSGGAGSENGSSITTALSDGNSATGWSRSATGAIYAGVQYSSPQPVSGMILIAYDQFMAPTQFKLQYSDNGSTYTDAFVSYDHSWASNTSSRTHPQIAAVDEYKYYRLLIDDIWDARFALIHEMELHTAISGPDIATLDDSGGYAVGGQTQANGEVYRAYDNTTATQWFTDGGLGTTAWGAFCFATPKQIQEYSITCTDSRTPKTWRFQGSNDFTSWTTLDTQSSITFSVPETKTYNFSLSGSGGGQVGGGTPASERIGVDADSTLVKIINKPLPISSTPAFNLTRVVGKLIRLSATVTFNLLKQAGKRVSTTVTPIMSIPKSANKFILVAITSSILPLLSVNKLISSTATSIIVVLKAMTHSISAAITPTAVVDKIKIFLREISVATTPILQSIRSISTSVVVSAQGLAEMSRAIFMNAIINASADTIQFVVKNSTKLVTAVSMPTPLGNALKVLIQIINISTTPTIGVVKSIGKIISTFVSGLGELASTIIQNTFLPPADRQVVVSEENRSLSTDTLARTVIVGAAPTRRLNTSD